MMNLFVDTEFLPSKDGSRVLLSIGVCGPLSHEFYGELDVAMDASTNEFIAAHVLPQLGKSLGIRGDHIQVGRALVAWLRLFQRERIELCYDYHVDRIAFEELVDAASATPSVEYEVAHVGYLLGDPDANAAANACWAEIESARGLRKHHALADALALRARFNAVHNVAPSEDGALIRHNKTRTRR